MVHLLMKQTSVRTTYPTFNINEVTFNPTLNSISLTRVSLMCEEIPKYRTRCLLLGLIRDHMYSAGIQRTWIRTKLAFDPTVGGILTQEKGRYSYSDLRCLGSLCHPSELIWLICGIEWQMGYKNNNCQIVLNKSSGQVWNAYISKHCNLKGAISTVH